MFATTAVGCGSSVVGVGTSGGELDCCGGSGSGSTLGPIDDSVVRVGVVDNCIPNESAFVFVVLAVKDGNGNAKRRL